MTWSGVCLRAIVSVIPPVSIVGHEYSHSHWTTFRGPNHEHECWALSASSVHGEIPCSEPPVNRQGWTVALNANIGWLRTTITGGSAWEYWWLSKSQIFKSTQSTEDQQYFFFLMPFLQAPEATESPDRSCQRHRRSKPLQILVPEYWIHQHSHWPTDDRLALSDGISVLLPDVAPLLQAPVTLDLMQSVMCSLAMSTFKSRKQQLTTKRVY